ncbi:MAG: putative glycolipid-binding domain-containing protein [Pseudonocardiales bacterium]
MDFHPLPASAAWLHHGSRSGFEVVFFHTVDEGYRIAGHTTAVESGQAWLVGYEIYLDRDWVTRTAVVSGHSASGTRSTRLAADGLGRWQVDGIAAPHLDGCLDVDLESSALTNAFPIHRLGVPVGSRADAPAAYIRAVDLSVSRLEQTYSREHDTDAGQRYEYAAPAFDFACTVVYDDAGLVLDYPRIATRVELGG